MAEVDLATLEFFSSFNPEQLATIRASAEECEAEVGGVLIEQGRVGQEAFVIVEGEAEIVVAGQRVASAASGSIVGEMALLDSRPRSATVRAATKMVLLRFDSKKFRALVDAMPASVANEMAARSQALRQENLSD